MRKALLIIFIMLTYGIPLQALAQNDKILGQLLFIPPLSRKEAVDAVVQVYTSDDQPVDDILVDPETPYRFNKEVQSDGKLIIRVKVDAPNGYFATRSQYIKFPNRPFNEEIRIKRSDDIYVDYINSSKRAESPQSAINVLRKGEKFATTVPQQLEINRQIGARYAEQGDYEEQQKALANFYDSSSVQELSAVKKRVYWAERLDGFLNWMNYSKLRMPEQDFGKLLVQPHNQDKLEIWKKILEDFKVAYPYVVLDSTAFTDEDITNQLKIINSTVHP